MNYVAAQFCLHTLWVHGRGKRRQATVGPVYSFLLLKLTMQFAKGICRYNCPEFNVNLYTIPPCTLSSDILSAQITNMHVQPKINGSPGYQHTQAYSLIQNLLWRALPTEVLKYSSFNGPAHPNPAISARKLFFFSNFSTFENKQNPLNGNDYSQGPNIPN